MKFNKNTNRICKNFIFLVFILIASNAQGSLNKKKVKFSADSLEYYRDENGKDINKLTGNVKFIKNNLQITADEANYEDQKKIEARGNVVIEKLRSNNTKLIIKTEYLVYLVEEEYAEFKDGVTLIEGKNILHSEIGEYLDAKDTAKFFGNVTITNEDQIVKCDMLSYENIDNNILNQHREILSNIDKYKREKKIYLMEGHININVFKQNLIMKSDYCAYYREEEKLKLYGYPILKKTIKKDDFFIYSKKLIIENDNNSVEKNKKKLKALEHVSLFNKNIKAKSNKIEFIPSESRVYFGVNSIFWTEDSQLTANNVKLKINDDNIEKMILTDEALIIQKDEFKNYNQVKGDDIYMIFSNNQVTEMNIKGSAQSIQFLSNEQDKKLIGINHIKCEEIKVYFGKKNKAKKVLFLGKKYDDTLGGFMMAPKNAKADNTRFFGFKWRDKEKPNFEEVSQLMNDRSSIKKDSITTTRSTNNKLSEHVSTV